MAPEQKQDEEPRFQNKKLNDYHERLLICLAILDTLDLTSDDEITAAHVEALAIWKEQ